MARIYKTSDRVTVKIDELTIKIAPLNLHQKNQIQRMMLDGQKTQDLPKLNQALILAIKYCLKDIKGLEDNNEESYKLEFENGELTDECLDDLMNIEAGPKLIQTCAAFVSGIPKEFKIEGVSFVDTGKKT